MISNSIAIILMGKIWERFYPPSKEGGNLKMLHSRDALIVSDSIAPIFKWGVQLFYFQMGVVLFLIGGFLIFK